MTAKYDQTSTSRSAQPARIPQEHQELWRQRSDFQFDEPDVPHPFSRRLAKRMNWKYPFTLQVIDEYRKFLYLLKTAGHMVTPSQSVDEVWHLHLNYTVSYWEHLCVGIFKEPMHHHPGNGSNADLEKFAAIYQRTLEDYTAVFGEPPANIWGRPNPLINWRKVLIHLPLGKRTRSKLLDLFPHPADEAD